MIKRTLVLADCHLNDMKAHPSYLLVKRFASTFDPHQVILLGDFSDCSALSAWDMDKKKLMEGRRHVREMKMIGKELDFWQTQAKKIVYIEGNHEDRITRYIEKNPEIEGMVEIQTVLDFEGRGITWVPMNELYKDGHLYYVHGTFLNKFHTNKTLITYGCSLVYGHCHMPQAHTLNMRQMNPIQAQSLGCLCDHNQPYLRKRHANWLHGFGIVYTDTKTGQYNLYPVNIIDNRFMWNGKVYK